MYHALVGKWLWMSYRNGAQWMGGWSGLPDAEVCARMAPGSETLDWVNDTGAPATRCVAMIARGFAAFETTAVVLMYVCLLWMALTCVRDMLFECVRVRRKHTTPAAYVLQHSGALHDAGIVSPQGRCKS